MDNISFERIWQENDFFEVRIIAQSELVRAITDFYTTDSDISDLANALTSFPLREDSEYFWKPTKVNSRDSEFTFKVIQKDRCGHLLIEVYMPIEDGDIENNHHCSFFIQTEIGLINTFGKRLLSINKPYLGAKIALADSD